MTEVWAPAVGYADYEASSAGRIRRVKYSRGYARNELPFVTRAYLNITGYLVTNMRADDGSCCPRLIHQIVCATFHGAKPDGQYIQVCHKDGDPTNNCAVNLYWGTASENSRDAFTHGTHHRGKLRPDDVKAIRTYLSCGLSKRDIAQRFGVQPNAIGCIASGRTWGWVL